MMRTHYFQFVVDEDSMSVEVKLAIDKKKTLRISMYISGLEFIHHLPPGTPLRL